MCLKLHKNRKAKLSGIITILLLSLLFSSCENTLMETLEKDILAAGPDTTYTITYNGNGNTSGDVPIDSNEYFSESIATVANNTGLLSKTGYTFSGWNTNAEGTAVSYDEGDTFSIGSLDIILYAKWSPNDYSITFNKNDLLATGSMENQILACDTSGSLNPCLFSKANYVFAGWATSEEGAVAYLDEANYVMGSQDVTLYAIWVNSITFDKNDIDAEGTMFDQTISSGDTAYLNACGFTKSGWTFAGWATSSEGAVQYLDQAMYTMGTSNLTLYAKWICDFNSIDYREMVTVPGSSNYYQDYFINGTEYNFKHTISSFSIGKYEVTYDLWYEVYSWAISHGYTFANPGMEGNDGVPGAEPAGGIYEPVTTINWRDAIVWCNAYSEMSGFSPVYFTNAAFTSPLKISTNNAEINTTQGSEDNPFVNWSADGYRLPSEGEWQYAAGYQDGTNWTPHDFASGATEAGIDPTVLDPVSWNSFNSDTTGSGKQTHKVGLKLGNQLGIYDMSGNIAEFCWDWYADYPTVEQTDYRGPSSGSRRIVRGGDYIILLGEYAVNHLIGVRASMDPYINFNTEGFRVVR